LSDPQKQFEAALADRYRLQRELGGRLSDSTIAQCVSAALEELGDARIKTDVTVLTSRLARERLIMLLDTRN